MKIKKPEDEKYFKDIVLNDILTEISNERGVPVTPRKKKQNTQQKTSTKTLFILSLAILLVLFTITLFKLVTDATTNVAPMTQDTVVTTEESDEDSWKMPEDSVVYKKPVAKKKAITKPIEINVVKSKPQPKQKTERELAKEALRQQMLN